MSGVLWLCQYRNVLSSGNFLCHVYLKASQILAGMHVLRPRNCCPVVDSSLLPICSHPIVTRVFLQHQCCLLSFPLLSASSEWWKAAIKLMFLSKGTSRKHQETEQTSSAHNTFKTKVPYMYLHLPMTHIGVVSLQHGEISDWRQPEFL